MNDELILFIGGTVTKDILKFKFFSVTPGDLGTPALNFMLIIYVSEHCCLLSLSGRRRFRSMFAIGLPIRRNSKNCVVNISLVP